MKRWKGFLAIGRVRRTNQDMNKSQEVSNWRIRVYSYKIRLWTLMFCLWSFDIIIVLCLSWFLLFLHPYVNIAPGFRLFGCEMQIGLAPLGQRLLKPLKWCHVCIWLLTCHMKGSKLRNDAAHQKIAIQPNVLSRRKQWGAKGHGRCSPLNEELKSPRILQNHAAMELWFPEKSDLSSISWGMWWWPWQQLRRPWAGESSEFSAFSKMLAISLVQHDHCWHAWTPEWCLLVISMLPKMCWWRGLVPNRSRIFYTSSLQKHVERKQDIYLMITGVLQARQAKGSLFFPPDFRCLNIRATCQAMQMHQQHTAQLEMLRAAKLAEAINQKAPN